MPIIRIDGCSPDVYSIIAPLAMDPAVIRKRRNLPIVTKENYTWHVLKKGKKVKAFVGEERLANYTKLQAFVVLDANDEELQTFLEEVVTRFEKSPSPMLTASVLNEYAVLFGKAKFQVTGYKTNWTDLAIVKHEGIHRS